MLTGNDFAVEIDASLRSSGSNGCWMDYAITAGVDVVQMRLCTIGRSWAVHGCRIVSVQGIGLRL